MSEKPIRSDNTPTLPIGARAPRDSEVRMREADMREAGMREAGMREAGDEPAQAELRRVRKRAVTLRSQGWKWEIQGRAAAFREAAGQVRKWLLDKGDVPTENEIRFVVQLLEQSAEVYEAADDSETSR